VAGGVRCWGTNNKGILGDGTTIDQAVPVDLVGLSSGMAVASAADNGVCALTSAGGVKCWGNTRMTSGFSTFETTAVDVFGLTSGIAAVAGGYEHTCVLTVGGGVECWTVLGYVQDGWTHPQML